MEKSAETFGKKLKQLREDEKLTQAALGKELGVSGPTISEWEHGYYLPTHDDIDRIAARFEMPVRDLFSIAPTDEKKRKPTLRESLEVVSEHWLKLAITQKKIR